MEHVPAEIARFFFNVRTLPKFGALVTLMEEGSMDGQVN